MGKKLLYKDKWSTIFLEPVVVRGKRVHITSRVEPDVAVVIPILDDGRLLLERQYRHTLRRYMYEFPAGMVEKKEKPVTAAKRELQEETGYVAKSVVYLFSQYPSMYNTRRFHFYRAKGLRQTGKTHFDPAEEITLVRFMPAEVEEMIKNGKIKDAKTVAGYLYYRTYK